MVLNCKMRKKNLIYEMMVRGRASVKVEMVKSHFIEERNSYSNLYTEIDEEKKS